MKSLSYTLLGLRKSALATLSSRGDAETLFSDEGISIDIVTAEKEFLRSSGGKGAVGFCVSRVYKLYELSTFYSSCVSSVG